MKSGFLGFSLLDYFGQNPVVVVGQRREEEVVNGFGTFAQMVFDPRRVATAVVVVWQES